MPTDEAIDLIATLPDGSLYVSAMNPARSWSEERSLVTDVCDAITWLSWALAIDKEKVPEPPRAVRPADVIHAREAEARRKRAKEILEHAQREEV